MSPPLPAILACPVRGFRNSKTAFLHDRKHYSPLASGGSRRAPWPATVVAFLESFVPLQSPANYQLVADELDRLRGFKRARSNVEAHIREHLSHLIPARPRKSRPGLPAADARADVAAFEVWRPLAPGHATFRRAWEVEDRYGSSWWYSLVVAAALESGSGILLSEDLRHGQPPSGLRVLAPNHPDFQLADLPAPPSWPRLR